MLNKLDIRDYTVLARAEIRFSPGLNVITGETGVGKSLLLEAVGALLGERRSGLPIRQGAEKAVIEAEFTSGNHSLIQRWLNDNDLSNELPVIFHREFTSSGRTRVFINDTPVNLNQARDLGSQLLDIHGQHDTVTLFERARQLSLLDSYLNHKDLVINYRSLFDQLSKLRQEHKALRHRLDDSQTGRDSLLLQKEELDKLTPREGEIDEIDAELIRLENAEKIFELGGNICDLLNEAPESAVERITEAAEQLGDLIQFDNSLSEWDKELSNVRSVLIELNRTLQNLNQSLNHDPDYVEKLRERYAALKGFQKRWNYQNRDLTEVTEEITKGLDELSGLNSRVREIGELIGQKEQELLRAGEALSEARKAAAKSLETDIQQHLKSIGMEKARFQVQFEELNRTTPYPDGLDRLDYMLSPNPKVPFQTLQKVASGGELSRILLALKSALTDQDKVETLIFDEIDQGISGRVARMVGLKLFELARKHQVIVVTHLPQIASLGDVHFSVRSTDQEATAEVIQLDENARLEEIATLLSATGISEGVLQNAREMIESADQLKGPS